ncbi:hypothetical protein A2Y85_03730 [candidate division WOR-3 bacterium RBG_13_43_14]|uniref:Uncharacterized protein n=1 Tax=candidate division WOR-3 bacterium RBG_13_43_14 TaxID=1802590 RepID=A0A1F4U9D3_UNCW3|nr:MAG: hypothetical protein A2Y85_03730 [candidate division WOR-3 bacterium RBG_13_43_14]
MSEDPIGFNIESPQMMNDYLYVENNPVNRRDITGLFVQCWPVISWPGFWHDVGTPEFLGFEWILIHARQERGRVLPGIYPLRCVFMEILNYIQQQARTWCILEFCIDTDPCAFNVFFRTSQNVELRDVLRQRIGKTIEKGQDYTYLVIPELECWNLQRGGSP